MEINFPPESILFLRNIEPRNNYFKSQLFLNLQKKNVDKDDEPKDQFINGLDDILKCVYVMII